MTSNVEKILWLFLGIFLCFAYLFSTYISIKVVAVFVLVTIGGVFFLLPIRWALSLMFLYIGLEGFIKIVTNYNPIVHVGADLLSLTLLGRIFLQAMLKGKRFPDKIPPLTILFGFHFLWVFICFFNPYSLGLIPSLAGLKVYFTMMILFFFGYYFTESKRDFKIFALPWLIVTCIHVWFSLYQSAEGVSSVLNIHPGYAKPLAKLRGQAFRPFGLTHLAGLPAIYIYLAAPFLLYFFTQTKNTILKMILGLQIPLWVMVSLVCQVRSALLKLIVAGGAFLILFMVSRPKKVKGPQISFKKKALAGAFLIAGLVFGLPKLMDYYTQEQQDNVMAIERSLSLFDFNRISHARKGGMKRFLSYVEKAPLGAGLSRTGAAGSYFRPLIQKDPYFGDIFFADNFFISTLVDLGIPGMLLMTLLLFLVIFKGLLKVKKIENYDLKVIHISILCALFSCALGSYGAESALYNPEAAFFWFFSGVMMKVIEIDYKTTPAPAPASNTQTVEYDFE